MRLLYALALLGFYSPHYTHSTSVNFVECECQAVVAGQRTAFTAFTPVGEQATISNFVATASGGLNCPGNDDFPSSPGLELKQNSPNLPLLTGTLLSNVGAVSNKFEPFEIFISISATNVLPTGQSFSVFEANTIGDNLLKITLAESNSGGLLVTMTHNFFGSPSALTGRIFGSSLSGVTLQTISIFAGIVRDSGDNPSIHVAMSINGITSGALFVQDSELIDDGSAASIAAISKYNFFTGVPSSLGYFVKEIVATTKNPFAASGVLGTVFAGVFTNLPAFPAAVANDFQAVEEQTTQFNLENTVSSTTDFTFNLGSASANGGVVAALSALTFSYTGKKDFFGPDTITFTATSAIAQHLQCSKGSSFSLQVTNSFDPPVPTSPAIKVFAGVQKVFGNTASDRLATHIDDPDNLLDGEIEFRSLPEGSFTTGSGCNTNVAIGSSISMSDSSVILCFQPSSNAAGNLTARYVVRATTNLAADSAEGVITFNVESPVTPNFGAIQPVLESEASGTLVRLQLQTATPVEVQDGAANPQVVITKLPDPKFVVLYQDAAGDIQLTQDQRFARNAEIFFEAKAPNRRRVSGSVFEQLDLLGNPIGCSSFPAGQTICPITLEFKGASGDATSIESGVVNFLITAIDNKSPAITLDGTPELFYSLPLVVETGEASSTLKNLGEVVTVVNDNGSDIFPVEVTVTRVPEGDYDGLEIEFNSSTLVQVSAADCTLGGCTVDTFTISGAPSAVSELLNTMTIRLKGVDTTDLLTPQGKYIFSVSGGADLVLKFVVDDDLPNILDNEFFLYGISGGGGLLVLVVLGYFVRRSAKKRKENENKKLMKIGETTIDGEKIARKRERSARDQKQKRRFRDDASDLSEKRLSTTAGQVDPDSDIFDWEKHFDENTKQPYFFNPKTGATSWDPPSVKVRKGNKKRSTSDIGDEI